MPRGASRGNMQRLMKYGVISVVDMADDLLNWRSLYVSGRLHKPVRAAVACACVAREPVACACVAREPVVTLRLARFSWPLLSGRGAQVLVIADDGSLARPLRQNLMMAAASALLQVPRVFTLHEFFMVCAMAAALSSAHSHAYDGAQRVAALSYTGDFRVGFAEHPRKVRRRVRGGGGTRKMCAG